MKKINIIENTKKLAKLLSLPAIDGNISLLAASGLLTIKSAPIIALSLIAGPVSLIVASSLGGNAKENVIAGLFAGLIALSLVVMAALIGSQLDNIINLNILKVFGGIALIIIGMSIIGLKIPENIPMIIIGLGIIISLIIK
jgi:hypothetical protein